MNPHSERLWALCVYRLTALEIKVGRLVFHGKKSAEIASALNRSVGTVRQAFYRLRCRLQLPSLRTSEVENGNFYREHGLRSTSDPMSDPMF